MYAQDRQLEVDHSVLISTKYFHFQRILLREHAKTKAPSEVNTSCNLTPSSVTVSQDLKGRVESSETWKGESKARPNTTRFPDIIRIARRAWPSHSKLEPSPDHSHRQDQVQRCWGYVAAIDLLYTRSSLETEGHVATKTICFSRHQSEVPV